MDCPATLYNILIATGIGVAFVVSCATNVALCCRRDVYECPYCDLRVGRREAVEHLATCQRRIAHFREKRQRRAAIAGGQINPMTSV